MAKFENKVVHVKAMRKAVGELQREVKQIKKKVGDVPGLKASVDKFDGIFKKFKSAMLPTGPQTQLKNKRLWAKAEARDYLLKAGKELGGWRKGSLWKETAATMMDSLQ